MLKTILISGVIGALIGAILCFLILQQSWQQTRNQFEQNQKHQIEVIDSLRKAGYGGLLTNLISKIEQEINNNPSRKLSEETINQMAAVSYAFRPEEYVQGDSLISPELSSERGLLLLLLSKTNIDSGSFDKIKLKVSFTGAFLRKADLSHVDLSISDLKGSDFKESNLMGANLQNANLMLCNLWGADLSKVNLNSSQLERADLRWSRINEATLKQTQLHGTDLSSAQIRNSDLSGANLDLADLHGTLILDTNFENADLSRTSWKRAVVKNSNFSNAKFSGANLSESTFNSSNLTGVELSGVIVGEQNWLSLLHDWNIIGAEELQRKYKLINEGTPKKPHFILRKNETK